MQSAAVALAKHLRVRIKAIIDADETVLQGASDCLKSVGRLDFSGEPVAALAKAALGRHRKAKSNTDDTSMFEAKEAGAKLSKNFTRLSNMPLVHLKRWLQLVENSIFTDTNLRTVMARGDRNGPIERMCMLMEHTYGIDPQAPFFEVGREEMGIELFEEVLPALDTAAGHVAPSGSRPEVYRAARAVGCGAA